METINGQTIKINAHAELVHITRGIDAEGVINYPLCGAPGNTPGRARTFKPVIVEGPATCKRCIIAARTPTQTKAKMLAAIADAGSNALPIPQEMTGLADAIAATKREVALQTALYPEHWRALRNVRDFGPLASQWIDKTVAERLIAGGYCDTSTGKGMAITDKGMEELKHV